MATQAAHDVGTVIGRLRGAVRPGGGPAAITERVKGELEEMIAAGGIALPERFRASREEGYCRRLLHRDGELGWTALVMTWAPGQATPLHDHAGIWCVEGVVEGEMDVVRYELLAEEGDLCRFAERGRIHTGVGDAGALIPPFEHHVLANASPERIAMTLHVYGGEMDHCSVFEPVAGDREARYRKRAKRLSYTD